MSAKPTPRAQALWRRGFAAVCAASLTLLSACASELLNPSQGRVAIHVKWPAKKAAFTIQAIPENTARIEISIRGEGIPEGSPLKAAVTPGGGENASTFIDVPIGPKFVQGVALNEAGEPVAVGSVPIAVQPNKLVEAHLVLIAVDPVDINPLPTPTPSPSPSASVDPNRPSPSPTPTPSFEPQRIIETVAGDGLSGAIDAKDPLSARFRTPRGLAFDAARSALYVADAEHRLIRRIDLVSGEVRTIAGRPTTATSGPIGVPPALAGADSGVPSGLAVGPEGDLYFCDRDNHMIRKITAGGVLENVAGTGRNGYLDGPAGQAEFAYPTDLSVDQLGNVYVADTYNNSVRRITGGQVTTVVGAGPVNAAGRTVPAPSVARPLSIVVDNGGRFFYVGEGDGHRVARYDVATGALAVVAGSGQAFSLAGEGGPALQADLPLPLALAIDVNGDLLIADGWAYKSGPLTLEGEVTFIGPGTRILRLTADGRLVRIAGKTTPPAFSGDGGDPREAELNNPSGLAVDANGRLFVADSYNNRIRVIRPAPLATPAPTPTPAPSASAAPSPGAPASVAPSATPAP